MRAPQSTNPLDAAVQRSEYLGRKFAKLASQHGGITQSFHQAELLRTATVGEHGICLGMAILWLVGARSGQSELDRALSAGRARVPAIDYVLEARNVGEDRLGTVQLNHQSSQQFSHRFFRLRIAAQFITAHSGYHLIKTPNHAMAAESQAGRFRFFDPNLGEALFTNSAAFHGFFEAWMSKQSIQTAYRGKKARGDRKVDHNTLHLTVEHYA